MCSYCSTSSERVAALTRSHSSLRPFSPACPAVSSSDSSAAGSSAAAALTCSAWAGESAPERIAAAVSGRSATRRAVPSAARAAPTVVPAMVATQLSMSRKEPSPTHAPVWSSRPTARVRPAPASFSSAMNCSTAVRASGPLSVSGSRSPTSVRARATRAVSSASTDTSSGVTRPSTWAGKPGRSKVQSTRTYVRCQAEMFAVERRDAWVVIPVCSFLRPLHCPFSHRMGGQADSERVRVTFVHAFARSATAGDVWIQV